MPCHRLSSVAQKHVAWAHCAVTVVVTVLLLSCAVTVESLWGHCILTLLSPYSHREVTVLPAPVRTKQMTARFTDSRRCYPYRGCCYTCVRVFVYFQGRYPKYIHHRTCLDPAGLCMPRTPGSTATGTAQALQRHRTVTGQSLCSRRHRQCAATLQVLYSRCAVAVRSLCSRCAVVMHPDLEAHLDKALAEFRENIVHH